MAALQWRRLLARRVGIATSAPASVADGGCVAYDLTRQVPAFIQLPIRGQGVRFRLHHNRPVHALLLQIQEETRAQDVSICTRDGDKTVRWCRSTSIEDVLREGLKNDMHVVIQMDAEALRVELPSLTERIRPLEEQYRAVTNTLRQLEEIKLQCDEKSRRSANRLVWAGLGGLCAQWGLMARLTWWEYSWDVMEPISYFVSFGTGIVGYMFFTVTRREYSYEAMTDLHLSAQQRRRYRQMGLDTTQYLQAQRDAHTLGEKIERTRAEYAQ